MDEIVSADLTDPGQTDTAVKDSEVVYLTVGLPYKLEVWQEQWPLIMENVISTYTRTAGFPCSWFSLVSSFCRCRNDSTASSNLAPGGKRLAVHVGDVNDYIWVYDIPRQEGRKLAATGKAGWTVWMPDAETVSYVSWRPGTESQVHKQKSDAPGSTIGRSYDVSPDGPRLLAVKRTREPIRTKIHIVQNLFEELESLVPTRN